jgi:hypothetical protein
MIPKQRFWKDEQKITSGFSIDFSMVRSPNWVRTPLKSASKLRISSFVPPSKILGGTIAQFRTHDWTKGLSYVSTQQSGQFDTFLFNHFSAHWNLAWLWVLTYESPFVKSWVRNCAMFCSLHGEHSVACNVVSHMGREPCSEQKIAQFRTHYLTKKLAYVSTQQSGYFPIDTEMI